MGWNTITSEEDRLRFLGSRCILASTNRVATRLNNMIVQDHILDDAGEEVHVFRSSDTIEEEDHRNTYPQELLHTIDASGLPPHELKLKVGCPVVALKTLPPYIVNGTRLLLTTIDTRVLHAVIISGPNKGQHVFVPKLTTTPSDEAGLGFTLRRTQFPIRVAYAMTINKAQGLTLENVGVHLQKPVFGHGQLYVAMSRVGNPDHVSIYQADRPGVSVSNVVYREALLPNDDHPVL
jgi:ATP-dependent DNA helicase PIF1